MALTIVQVETVLIRRVGALFTAVGLDGTTIDGNNPDLVDPVGASIRNLGGSVTTITNVVDADLAGIVETDYDELLDVAELRALQSAHSAATTLINTAIGPRKEELSSIANSLAKLIEQKQKQTEELYGYGLRPLESGLLELDFAEHDQDNVDELGW